MTQQQQRAPQEVKRKSAARRRTTSQQRRRAQPEVKKSAARRMTKKKTTGPSGAAKRAWYAAAAAGNAAADHIPPQSRTEDASKDCPCAVTRSLFESVCAAHDRAKARRLANPSMTLSLSGPPFKRFADGSRVYKGLHRWIDQCVLPRGEGAGGKVTTTKRRRALRGDGSNHASGIMAGTVAHKHIAAWAQQRYPIGSAMVRPTRSKFANGFIVQAANQWRWISVDAEVPVCSPATRIATAADVVVFDTLTGRITVVEVKCGMNGSWDRPLSPHPLRRFDHLPDTPHARAIVQVAMTLVLYARQFGIPFTSLDACVVRLSNVENAADRRVHVERIPLDILTLDAARKVLGF